MAIQPLQMLAVGEFLEKHGASDGLMDTFKAICEELVEGQKPSTNTTQAEIAAQLEEAIGHICGGTYELAISHLTGALRQLSAVR